MDVRDVGVALWRQRPLVGLILLITGGAVAAGISLAPKSYAATATISAAEQPGVADTEDPDALRATLAELANSQGVVDEVLLTDPDRPDRGRAASLHPGRLGTGHDPRGCHRRGPRPGHRRGDRQHRGRRPGRRIVVKEVAGPSPGPVADATTSDTAHAPDHLQLSPTFGFPRVSGCCWPSAWRLAAVWRDRRTHTVDDAAAVENAATAPLLAHLTPPRDLTTMPALHPGPARQTCSAICGSPSRTRPRQGRHAWWSPASATAT